MKDNNFGQFDYFFEISKTYFKEELVSDILHNNFIRFHISGYNDGKGNIVGDVHDGNNEYPIKVYNKTYPDETATVITSLPRYYVSPKLEVEKKKNESILRIDKIKGECFVMKQFTAHKDNSDVSIEALIYDKVAVKQLIDEHEDECRNTDLSREKLQSYNIYPNATIRKEINGSDIKAYHEFLDELTKTTQELEYDENTHKRPR